MVKFHHSHKIPQRPHLVNLRIYQHLLMYHKVLGNHRLTLKDPHLVKAKVKAKLQLTVKTRHLLLAKPKDLGQPRLTPKDPRVHLVKPKVRAKLHRSNLELFHCLEIPPQPRVDLCHQDIRHQNSQAPLGLRQHQQGDSSNPLRLAHQGQDLNPRLNYLLQGRRIVPPVQVRKGLVLVYLLVLFFVSLSLALSVCKKLKNDQDCSLADRSIQGRRYRAVARALIGGCIFIYSYYARRISFEISCF